MSHDHSKMSGLEWTRMTSRSQSPYFVPKPTPGYSSAYDSEKVRRNIPAVNLEKSVGRPQSPKLPERVNEVTKSPQPEYRYGITEAEIEKIKQLKKRKKFLNERDEYVKAEGKTHKIVGASNMNKATGRDSPIYWQSKESFDDSAHLAQPPSPTKNEKLPGFVISKAPRFRAEAVPEAKLASNVAPQPTHKAPTQPNSNIILKYEVGTFGRSPSRPEPIPDNRPELSVNYEYLKGHLTRTVHLSRYASRTPGEEEKPSSKFKQLFKRLQRPYVPLSNRLRAPKGMTTMSSVHKGDLPSILRHADNDRLRATSAMAMNETPTLVSEILYPQHGNDLPK